MTKNEKVKLALQKTREKRKFQVCKVYEVKVDKSLLSKEKLEYLNRLFLEAKWWYNHILSQENVFKIDCKVKKVQTMNKDKQFETRELKCLTSSMRQNIHKRLIINIKSLTTNKKKNKKVGKLKFKSSVYSIPGRFFIKNNNLIRIEGFKKCFRVRGLDQIPKDSEIACIKLIRKNSDFYFHITTFQNKEIQIKTKQYIGIDLGIKDSMNFANGVKVDIDIKESKRIKKIQQQFSKKQKHSKNRFKNRLKLKKAYDKRTNKKKDVCNKIVNYLNTNFDYICVQNDNIAGWQRLYGKKINSSIIGRTLGKLELLPKTIMVPRFYPSTQLCPMCSCKTKLSLSERVFKCSNCGFEEDRDIKSAKMIELEGLKQKQIPMEYGELTLVENKTSTPMFEYFKTIPNIEASLCSMKQEVEQFNNSLSLRLQRQSMFSTIFIY